MSDEDDDEYHLPLIDQRVFGTGISRKRIHFVPPSSQSSSTSSTQAINGLSASEKYLSIVLQPSASPTPPPPPLSSDRRTTTTTTIAPAPAPAPAPNTTQVPSLDPTALCEICNLPIPSVPASAHSESQEKPHEASLVHQTCLPHSEPPSHLPRTHVGLKYLESYGWNPDSRSGLGAEGQGIRIPIKGKLKNDTVGLGVKIDGKKRDSKRFGGEEKVKLLDAGKVRKMEKENKRKAERLREVFYGREEVEKYLGGGGNG